MGEEAGEVLYLPYGRVFDDMMGIIIVKAVVKRVKIDEKRKKKNYKDENCIEALPGKVKVHARAG
jgi:hypothetical protein